LRISIAVDFCHIKILTKERVFFHCGDGVSSDDRA